MRTILAASICLSSCSQLFHTTPASLAALLPQEGLVIVLSPPGLACSSLPQLIPPASSHNSLDKVLSGASLRAALPTPPTASMLPHPTLRAGGQAAGTPEGKGGPCHRPEGGDSVAACRTALANLAAPCRQEPSLVGLAPSRHSHPALGN